MTRANLILDADIHELLRRRAFDEKKPISEVAREILREALAAKSAGKGRRGRKPSLLDLVGIVNGDGADVETFALLRRRHGLAAALRAHDLAATVPTVSVDRALHDRAVDWLRAHRSRSTSLVDAVSFVVMRDHGMTTAFAFDADFEKAGFRLYRPR